MFIKDQSLSNVLYFSKWLSFLLLLDSPNQAVIDLTTSVKTVPSSKPLVPAGKGWNVQNQSPNKKIIIKSFKGKYDFKFI